MIVRSSVMAMAAIVAGLSASQAAAQSFLTKSDVLAIRPFVREMLPPEDALIRITLHDLDMVHRNAAGPGRRANSSSAGFPDVEPPTLAQFRAYAKATVASQVPGMITYIAQQISYKLTDAEVALVASHYATPDVRRAFEAVQADATRATLPARIATAITDVATAADRDRRLPSRQKRALKKMAAMADEIRSAVEATMAANGTEFILCSMQLPKPGSSIKDEYTARLSQHISSFIAYPPGHEEKSSILRLSFLLQPDGRATEVTVTRCFGDPIFEDVVAAAFTKAQPLPPPPEAFRRTLPAITTKPMVFTAYNTQGRAGPTLRLGPQ